MIIETWIAVFILILISILCLIGYAGWITTDQRLHECNLENRLLHEEIRRLQGKLIVKTATDFHNEGKKK